MFENISAIDYTKSLETNRFGKPPIEWNGQFDITDEALVFGFERIAWDAKGINPKYRTHRAHFEKMYTALGIPLRYHTYSAEGQRVRQLGQDVNGWIEELIGGLLWRDDHPKDLPEPNLAEFVRKIDEDSELSALPTQIQAAWFRRELVFEKENVPNTDISPKTIQPNNGINRNQDGDNSTPESIKLYLREIGETPLLTAKEEITLAKTIAFGVEAQSILHDPNTPEDEIESLRQRVSEASKANKDLQEANLRLVVSVAKKYSGTGLDFLDLIQEGNIGLGRAVSKFDHRRGYRFSTYAYWWIRQAIVRAIADTGRTIRLPVHLHDEISKAKKAESQLIYEQGREPSIEEIADRLGVSSSRINELRKAALKTVSIDIPVGEGGTDEPTFADETADPLATNPVLEAEANDLKKHIWGALKKLTPRERVILRLRYSLETDKPEQTLDQIATALGLSKERVRQIEKEAKQKMRTPNFARKVRAYID